MQDKREHRRANLIYYLEVQEKESNHCLGHVVDISLGGIRMIGESKTNPGDEHNIRIILPEGSQHESIDVKAKSCWSIPDINPDYNASGLQFLETTEENDEVINELIGQYELGNSYSRSSY